MNARQGGNGLAIRPHRRFGRDLSPPTRSGPTATAQQLLDLAEQLSRLLVPVQADANYRRRLKGELILAAQQRRPQREAKLPPRRRQIILIGAAALGSAASVVGVIIAFVLRNRHGRTQPASLSPIGRG